MNKRDIYASHGVSFDGTYLNAPLFGNIRPLLKRGNSKTGERVYTFSMLPGGGLFTYSVNGYKATCAGTCGETCKGSNGCVTCYGFYGRLKMDAARNVAFINTVLTRQHLDWVYRALCAQIEADGLTKIRIHQTGDFDEFGLRARGISAPGEYALMWRAIAERFDGVQFWTYTKFRDRETLFKGLPNANVVRSKLPDGRYNYGACAEVKQAYYNLTGKGIPVHVCMCGTPSELHCQDCAACATYQYVLFLKHSTPDYDAKKDPDYPDYCEFVKSQEWDENGNRR